MPGLSAKYIKAKELVESLNLEIDLAMTLYHALEWEGFTWDVRNQVWFQQEPHTLRRFVNVAGEPTTHWEMRVTTHPDMMPDLLRKIQAGLESQGITVTLINDRFYKDRLLVRYFARLEGHAE